MTKAFANSMSTLADILKEENASGCDLFKKYVHGLSDADYTNVVSKWTEMIQDTEFESLCQQKNLDQLKLFTYSALESEHAETIVAGLGTDGGDRIAACMEQMNSFCRVQKNIPSGLMGRIENYAYKLANNISSGSCDISDINLNQIGQEVLSGCDTSEMSQLANNINELLPTLNTLKSGMPMAS